MRKATYFGLFLATVLLIIGCFNSSNNRIENNKSLIIHQSFQFDSSFNTCIIKNNKDFPITFRLKFNDMFPLDMSDIQDEIARISVENSIPIAEAAWKYVSENTFWNNPLTSENWQHNPVLFLNSLGGGMCDDIASVLASIWKKSYDSVRIVGLEGHVVSEVKIGENWQMFDADNEIAYLNHQNIVASVKELEDSSHWIAFPKKQNILGNKLFFNSPSPLTKRYASLYATKIDNQENTNWHLDFKDYSNTFSLPPHSQMEIYERNNRVFLKVVLTRKSAGDLQIPLVMYSAKGNFIFEEEGREKNVHKDIFVFNSKKFHHKIKVKSVKETSEIIFLVNPKLQLWRITNSLNTASTDSLIFETIKRNSFSPKSFCDAGLFFDKQINANYSKFTEIYFKKMDISYLKVLFSRFLDETNLTKAQKIEKVEKFVQFFQNENNYLKVREIFENTYPKSSLYLFIAIKENKMYYLNEMLPRYKVWE